MPSPFPGMDPYLENPVFWPGFHDSLVVEFKTQLNALIQPRYVAMIEERVYITDQHDAGRQTIIPDVHVFSTTKSGQNRIQVEPDTTATVVEPIEIDLLEDEVRDSFLAIYRLDDRQVVTIIEVLSPTNKAHGSYGQELFRKKRREVLSSTTNWVEVDLLREGERLVPAEYAQLGEDFVYVSRSGHRSRSKAWPIQLSQSLPTPSIPLGENDPEVPLNLQQAIVKVYDDSAYRAVIDYTRDPVPALPARYADWADQLLKSQGLRK